MKLLYLSCHAILEYDECLLFNELGIDWFSLGSYINPEQPVDPIRPSITHRVNTKWLSLPTDREKLSPTLLNEFDKIVIMHKPEWIEQNWDVLKGRDVIWRTIGQSTPRVEQRMQKYRAEGLKILRYSEREEKLENFAGADDIIHFYKDPTEFHGYTGRDKEVITFAQNMKHRGEYCHFDLFEKITEGFPGKVYGPKNEDAGALNGGFLTYREMQTKMRTARCYIYTGTQPASYTLNFIEAWMSGIPVVAIGPHLWNTINVGDIYEIPDLIQNGVNGIWSDDIDFLRNAVNKLMTDNELARMVGQAGREKAIALFGKEVIKSKWQKFLSM